MSVDIEHRDLRSAIEFAVLMVEEANKGKRSLPAPSEVRAHVGAKRIPTGSLGRIRRAIEADEVFRERIAAGAVPELVDPIGLLWLQRPSGWEERAQALVAERVEAERDADLRGALKRAEKRRAAAEQVATRARAEIVERDDTIRSLQLRLDEVVADLAKADDAVAELRAELVDVRNEARHARDREAALRAKLDARPEPTAPVGGAADPVEPPPALSIDPDEVAEVADSVRRLADRLDAAVAHAASGPAAAESPAPTPRRRPLRLPGGVIASSAAAAEFLLRSDAAVLVDGYNVAKLGWPDQPLEQQRRRLLDGLENAARRFGSDVTVVFDGASVVGAHADRRRMVRVTYSPDGTTADDVICDEVRRFPAGRNVVVVTNDAEIVADVRAHGANVVPSNALLALL